MKLRLALTLPAATLIGFSGCGDDSPSDTSDTISDTSPSDAEDILESDTSSPDTNETTSDTAEDTTTPEDVADTTTPEDVADTTGTTGDTAQDTSPGDVITPPSTSVALVAWNGLSINSPARGSINVTTSTGSAFGPFATWKTGTEQAPVAFGSTANLIGDVDGDGLADLIAWNGLTPGTPARGSIQVFLSTGSAFADFTS